MSIITNLDSKDLHALCQIITPKEIKDYFKKHPRIFNRIKPGFRPDALSDSEVYSTVTSNQQEPFIVDYFENTVPQLLESFEKDFPDFGENNNYDYSSLIRELQKTPFANNPKLYFEITSQKYPDDAKEKVISQMEKKANTSSQKKTIKPVKASSTTVNKRIDELQDQVASLQKEKEEYIDKLTELQASYDQLNERIKYDESSIDLGVVFSDYEHLSVGMISPPSHDGKRWVYRLADIDKSATITQFIQDSERARLFSNRDRLFFNEEELPDGLLGVWGWNATPNINNPSSDYVVSQYYPQYSPVEFLIVEDCSTLDELIDKLSKGLSLSPSSHRFAITIFNNKTDKYNGVICNSTEIESKNDMVRLKSSVISLPVYSFERKDIIQLNDARGIYNKLQLGPADSVIKTISDSEIVKKLVLDSIPWSVFKQRGVAKAEWQNFKKYLDELKTEDLIESIQASLDCTSEDAAQQLDIFIENASNYLDASSFDDIVLKAVVEGDDELMSKCVEIAEEKWLSENKDIVEKANQELQAIQEQIANATSELSSIKEECEKEKEEAAPYRELIENGDALAAQVQEKVANRINAARKDASDFLSEMAFYYPNSTSSTPVTEPEKESSFFTAGIKMDEPIELGSWEDATDTIGYELEEAGVRSTKVFVLGEYLYSAFISQTPILLVGPNGSNIVDALSAALFGETAATLTLPDSYNQGIVEECAKSDSKIIKIVNPLSNSWIPYLPELFQTKGKYFCAVYPFPEDIQFEPNSLCNLFLPLYTELFVAAAPTNNFTGGIITSDYNELDEPVFEDAPHQKDIELLHSSFLVKNKMKTIAAYMNATGGGNYEDDVFSTLILPYGMATQQNDLLKELINGKWPISKDLQDELSQIWGDFE